MPVDGRTMPRLVHSPIPDRNLISSRISHLLYNQVRLANGCIGTLQQDDNNTCQALPIFCIIKFDWPMASRNTVTGRQQHMPKPYSVGSVSDLIVFLPDNMERVLASQFHHQHDLMALDGAPMKSLLPGHTCQTLFSWFRVQNKSCQLR